MSSKIFTIFLLAAVLLITTTKAESNKAAEHALIIKFFDTTDRYEIAYSQVALNVLQELLTGMLNRVPAEQRGPACESIQKYVNEIADIKDGNDILTMRAKLDELPTFGDKLTASVMRGDHAENQILKFGIFSIMAFPMKTQAAAATYTENVKAAVTSLKADFPAGRLSRHRKLSNIFNEFDRYPDLINENSLQKNFRKLEADYRAGRR